MTHNDTVPELTKAEFDDFIKEGLVFIDFFAEWCMPCLTMAPIIDDLSEKFEGKVKFGKVDVGENQDLAQKFDVVSIPNFVILKDGKVVHQLAGSTSQDELEDIINQFL